MANTVGRAWIGVGGAACLAAAALFSCGGKPAVTAPGDTTVNVSGGPAASDAAAPTTTSPPTTTTAVPDGAPTGTKLEPAAPDAGAKTRGEAGRRTEDIQAIIMARRDEARACYDKAFAAHPGIEGDLDIKWTIDPDGNVQNPEVDPSKSTIAEPSVGKCIIDIIKKIKFNKSDKGFETKTHYPFNFHPKQGQLRDAGLK